MRATRQFSADHPVNYMQQLDGLRALAIGLVLLHRWLPTDLGNQIPYGVTGVFIFFIISGFLITRILLESRDRPLGAALKVFYARRVLRIFPAYYLVVALFTLLGLEVMRETLGWNLSYTTNLLIFSTGEWPSWASHFWSLAIEEQFYLFWPFLILLIPARWLGPAIVAVILAAPVSRLALLLGGANTASINTFTLCALDFLGFGALLALLWERGQIERIRRPLAWAAALALIGYGVLGGLGDYRESPAIFALQSSLVPLFGGYLVLACASGRTGVFSRLLCARPVVYIGKISYGIYLLYGFISIFRWKLYGALGLMWLDEYAWLNLGVNLVLNITLAALMYELFESPILRLKKHFRYRSDSGPQPTAPVPSSPSGVPAAARSASV